MPLAAAAMILHKERTGRIATEPDVLTPVAASIARHTAIYARPAGARKIRRVRARLVHSAVFLDCGKVMRSNEMPYTDVCVRRSELATVIDKLRA